MKTIFRGKSEGEGRHKYIEAKEAAKQVKSLVGQPLLFIATLDLMFVDFSA